MIKITDDKKEKSQSWEASNNDDGGGSNGCHSYTINGFGKDELDCRLNFKLEVNSLLKKLNDIQSKNNKRIREISPQRSERGNSWDIIRWNEVEDKEIAKHDNELLNRTIACGFPRNRSLTNADPFHIGVDIGDGSSYSSTTTIEGSLLAKESLPKVRYGKLGYVVEENSSKSTDENQLNNMCKVENKETRIEDNVLRFRAITKSMNDLYEAKNKDYGDSFNKTLHEFGLVASAVKLVDKIRRFKNLMKADAKVKDESIEDTLIDLANYSVMTLLFLNEKKSNKLDGKL